MAGIIVILGLSGLLWALILLGGLTGRCRIGAGLVQSWSMSANEAVNRSFPSNVDLQLTRSLELKYPRISEVQVRRVFCAPGRARN